MNRSSEDIQHAAEVPPGAGRFEIFLHGAAVYPEFIQGDATPERLAAEIKDCLGSKTRRERTQAKAARLRELLHASTRGNAADWLLRQLGD